jgi:hypothetical protein
METLKMEKTAINPCILESGGIINLENISM